jgi:Ca2+-binding RTX toxin-like protein
MPPTIIDLGSANATFTGGNGDYLITGANGNNTVTLGDGQDQETLGDGNNTLTLGGGADVVNAGQGNNSVTAGSGADNITLTNGSNTITVGDGPDVIQAGSGSDAVTAGDGNDQITLGDGPDQVTAGNGNSTITVGNGAGDTILVGIGANTITIGIGTADVVHTAAGHNTVLVAAAAVGADSILGALTTSDGTGNTLVLTTAGTANVAGVSGFQTFQLANGGADSLTLADANFARLPGGSITVMGGDTANVIDASGLAAGHSVNLYAGAGTNVLTGGAGDDFFYGSAGSSTVDGGAGNNTMTFSGPATDYSISTVAGVTYVVGDGESDALTNIQQLVFGSVACFTTGTLIDVADGQTAVEHLQIGDEVVLARGGMASIRWIGRRSYAGRFLAANPNVRPIRFRAGSLGNGLPRRDLLVSPKHAMLLDGVLVPANCLVNGVTVVVDHASEQVKYFHVELDTHDVLLAEGAPSESFVDDDSRGMFHNAAEWKAMYPGRERLPAVYYAPRVEQGPELETIRRRLADVASRVALAA